MQDLIAIGDLPYMSTVDIPTHVGDIKARKIFSGYRDAHYADGFGLHIPEPLPPNIVATLFYPASEYVSVTRSLIENCGVLSASCNDGNCQPSLDRANSVTWHQDYRVQPQRRYFSPFALSCSQELPCAGATLVAPNAVVLQLLRQHYSSLQNWWQSFVNTKRCSEFQHALDRIIADECQYNAAHVSAVLELFDEAIYSRAWRWQQRKFRKICDPSQNALPIYSHLWGAQNNVLVFSNEHTAHMATLGSTGKLQVRALHTRDEINSFS